VRAGITGPWQLSGHNDLYYKPYRAQRLMRQHASFWIDIVIAFRTLPVVIRRMGVV
jgi:lipopolysaccharide/colanic/teichoic acid biosynthesis glycosyltransferase